MKPPRGLTAEELRLWREANKHTQKKRGAIDSDAEDEAMNAVVPPPVGGRLGGGRSKATLVPVTAPPHPSAYRGGGVRGTPNDTENLSPLKQLSLREAKRSFKPYGPVEATLDLHGLGKLEAYERVQHFILEAKRRGKRHVTIITGKGRGGEVGILRANLPHWLNEPAVRSLISAVAEARAEKGGAGVMHVLVKA